MTLHRYVGFVLFGLLLLLAALPVETKPAQAAQQCNPAGLCEYFIPAAKLPQMQAQQTPVWCWAASAQTIFRYYGHNVTQQVIVEKAFGVGVPIPSTGPPDVILKMLNSQYVDTNGQNFQVSVPLYEDQYQLMQGNLIALNMQPGFSNAQIFGELEAERPVFYADGPHAMVLVAGTAVNGNPINGWAMDPEPRTPFGAGPLADNLNIPAIGVRQLAPNEMHAFFAAQVVVH